MGVHIGILAASLLLASFPATAQADDLLQELAAMYEERTIAIQMLDITALKSQSRKQSDQRFVEIVDSLIADPDRYSREYRDLGLVLDKGTMRIDLMKYPQWANLFQLIRVLVFKPDKWEKRLLEQGISMAGVDRIKSISGRENFETLSRNNTASLMRDAIPELKKLKAQNRDRTNKVRALKDQMLTTNRRLRHDWAVGVLNRLSEDDQRKLIEFSLNKGGGRSWARKPSSNDPESLSKFEDRVLAHDWN